MSHHCLRDHFNLLMRHGHSGDVGADLAFFLDTLVGGEDPDVLNKLLPAFSAMGNKEDEDSLTREFASAMKHRHADLDGLKDSLYRKRAIRIKKELVPHVASSQWKLLDYGCGDGMAGTALIDSGYDVYGCDVANYLSPTSRVKYVKLKGNDIIAPDGSFDLVFANSVLHHCEDPRKAITEMGRVSREKICIIEDVVAGATDTERQIHQARLFISDYFYNRIFVGQDIAMPGNNHTEEEWLRIFEETVSPSWKVDEVIDLGWSAVLKPVSRKLFILSRSQGFL